MRSRLKEHPSLSSRSTNAADVRQLPKSPDTHVSSPPGPDGVWDFLRHPLRVQLQGRRGSSEQGGPSLGFQSCCNWHLWLFCFSLPDPKRAHCCYCSLRWALRLPILTHGKWLVHIPEGKTRQGKGTGIYRKLTVCRTALSIAQITKSTCHTFALRYGGPWSLSLFNTLFTTLSSPPVAWVAACHPAEVRWADCPRQVLGN